MPTCVCGLRARASMTSPSAERLLLIALASRRTLPLASVLESLSDPARSTMLRFAVTTFPYLKGEGGADDPPFPFGRGDCSLRLSLPLTLSVTTRCEREECSFTLCDAVARRLLPWARLQRRGGGGVGPFFPSLSFSLSLYPVSISNLTSTHSAWTAPISATGWEERPWTSTIRSEARMRT